MRDLLSYKSGELALSLLTRSQSPQTHGDFKASNSQWQRVRLLHEARMLDGKTTTGSMNRKFRFVGMFRSIFPSLMQHLFHMKTFILLHELIL